MNRSVKGSRLFDPFAFSMTPESFIDHGGGMCEIIHKRVNISYFREDNHYFYPIFALNF